ncbi:MAG TPA: SDR family NAD(P)-dependent oxidoreductase [Puia sp.]|jgi:uncharacterized oxidoreductase
MKISNNTILVTGGSAGIGFEIARQLGKDNKIIILGRDKERLQKAAKQLPNTTAIVGDVSDAKSVDSLVATLYRDHPDLNIVVNNAGKAHIYDLAEEGINAFEKAGEEMLTNYLSIIRLNEKLLPLLRKQPAAAIVHVSSIVSIVPNHSLAGYGASKAALHSYSLSLRRTLEKISNVRVFELQPPLVDTEFSAGIGGHNGIPASQVAADLVKALETDEYEIRVGKTENIYRLYLSSPEEAFNAMNPAPQPA